MEFTPEQRKIIENAANSWDRQIAIDNLERLGPELYSCVLAVLSGREIEGMRLIHTLGDVLLPSNILRWYDEESRSSGFLQPRRFRVIRAEKFNLGSDHQGDYAQIDAGRSIGGARLLEHLSPLIDYSWSLIPSGRDPERIHASEIDAGRVYLLEDRIFF